MIGEEVGRCRSGTGGLEEGEGGGCRRIKRGNWPEDVDFLVVVGFRRGGGSWGRGGGGVRTDVDLPLQLRLKG